MLERDDWLDLARKLDWELTYSGERGVFPEDVAGRPWLPGSEWRAWDDSSRTSYSEYVHAQHAKEASVHAVREAIGRAEDFQRLDRGWLSALKLHSATQPLAEFAAVIGNLRAARFGRDSAWRSAALLGALDELRHAQLPLLMMHQLVPWDRQFDFTHRLLHTDDWVAVAARHLVDEMLLAANPVELAIATHFVLENAFANPQLAGLAAVAHRAGDRMFEKMVQSIQTDQARHAQIGRAVLEVVVRHDAAYAQYLVDKWFWRGWLFFSVVTGFALDYLAPLPARGASFKELTEEHVLEPFQRALAEVGLKRPWYWEQVLQSVETYHHMVYASAYSYRATVWFDLVLPGPEERAWLRARYPRTWPQIDPLWDRLTERCRSGGPGVEWRSHGTTPVGFCSLCQLMLCGGTPERNAARVVDRDGRRSVFCSDPCQWIFEQEPARYAEHRDMVQRILAGDAPGNLLALMRETFGLDAETWGKDAHRGPVRLDGAGDGEGEAAEAQVEEDAGRAGAAVRVREGRLDGSGGAGARLPLRARAGRPAPGRRRAPGAPGPRGLPLVARPGAGPGRHPGRDGAGAAGPRGRGPRAGRRRRRGWRRRGGGGQPVNARRTYWFLESLGHRPSDYEVCSTALLYAPTPDRKFEVPTPAGAFWLGHQAERTLGRLPWPSFADPRRTTYAGYVQRQHERELFVDGLYAQLDDGARDQALAPAWRASLADALSALRFPYHGLQMVACYLGSVAPAGRVAIACAFQAADELRVVQRFAQRLGYLRRLDPAAGEPGAGGLGAGPGLAAAAAVPGGAAHHL